jgi:putative chitinase
MITLTANQLEDCSPYTNPKRIDLILPNLNNTLEKYKINGNLRVAHFLSQLIVESNHFRYIEELETGARYEGSIELGNVHKGDGRRFKGRGYIKIIGRKEYEAYKIENHVDVVSYPHVVLQPKICMDVSGWIWNKKQLNLLADQDDLQSVTKVLVGGYLILRERADALNKVKRVLGLV